MTTSVAMSSPDDSWKQSFYTQLIKRNHQEKTTFDALFNTINTLQTQNAAFKTQVASLRNQISQMEEKSMQRSLSFSMGSNMGGLPSPSMPIPMFAGDNNGNENSNIISGSFPTSSSFGGGAGFPEMMMNLQTLQQKNKEQEQRIFDLHTELSGAYRQQADTAQSLIEMSNQLKNNKQELKKRQQELDETKEKIVQLTNRIADLEAMVSRKVEAIELLNNEVKGVKADLEQREGIIGELKAKERVLTDKVVKENEQRVALMNQVMELESQLSRVNAAVKMAQASAPQTAQKQETLQEKAKGLFSLITGSSNTASTSSAQVPLGNIDLENVLNPQKKAQKVSTKVPSTVVNKVAQAAAINSIKVSDNNYYVATAGIDKQIKLWNVQTWDSAMVELSGSTKEAYMKVAFSPNSEYLLACNADRTAQVWSVNTGKLKQTLTGHEQKVFAGDISYDNTKVATGGYDRTIRIYELSRGDLLRTLVGTVNSSVNDLEFSKNTDVMCSGHFDSSIRFHDIRTYKHLHTISKAHNTTSISSVTYSKDGLYLLTSSSKELKVWDTRMLTTLAELSHPEFNSSCAFNKACFSPYGDYVAAGNSTGSIFIWNVAKKKVESILKGTHKSDVTGCCWTPDGQYILSSSLDKTWVVWG